MKRRPRALTSLSSSSRAPPLLPLPTAPSIDGIDRLSIVGGGRTPKKLKQVRRSLLSKSLQHSAMETPEGGVNIVEASNTSGNEGQGVGVDDVKKNRSRPSRIRTISKEELIDEITSSRKVSRTSMKQVVLSFYRNDHRMLPVTTVITIRVAI